ncbi:MAG: endonuclease MutS2 [Firmicutes bacterium]|nr:endonuclease MutS2 [Bacillota bacterium]
MKKTLATLEYNRIINLLAEHATSKLGSRLALELTPAADPRRVNALLDETDQARRLLDQGGNVPLHGLSDISESIERLARGAVLSAGELLALADLLRGCRRTRDYLLTKESIAPLLATYSRSLTPLPDFEELVELSIEGSRVSDQASARLKKIRQSLRNTEAKIEASLHRIMLSAWNQYLQDGYVSQRDGRYVLPVRSEHKNKVQGYVVASSGSGATLFIEPASIRNLTNQLNILRGQEEEEEYQVLAMLSGEAFNQLPALKINIETMAALDLVMAKGKFSRALNAARAESGEAGSLRLADARHPLLPAEEAVPLNLELKLPARTLLITGPNTGGKTVTLKTVGLLAAMHQSGLHIPAAPTSNLPVFDQILADIGDGQSLEHSLSTFSSHMGNIADILHRATARSLILMDEIGTGTDPLEGAALGASILEDLCNRGATTLATTHYGDLKLLADQHPGFLNGAMDFDPETLQPRYRLLIGTGGQSNGIWIAGNLGIAPHVLERARNYIGERGGRQGLVLEDEYQAPTAPPANKNTKLSTSYESAKLRLGDRVHIPARGISGIVAEPPNGKGVLTILVQGERERIPARRVRLEQTREELYPGEDYDLDIVLLSKQDRKLKKKLGKRHQPGLERVIKP